MPKQMRRTRKRRSGGAEAIDPAPFPSSVMAEGHQPSNKIMEWATTAGMPAPLKMPNVAHGGKRSMKRSMKHSRKHRGKRSMKRSRKHRGGNCGPCMAGLRP
jgi:hypothetical protein